MRVEQAIYGEVRGGHGLRLASTGNRVFSELTSRLDLPDTTPPGADWSPFVSGFPHGEHFVLARTFADPEATRPGMVLSHAVIAPLDEVISMSDLRPLFGLLITEPKQPAMLASCDLLPLPESPSTAVELVPSAEALVTRGTGPVVRIGVQGFDGLVIALWARLWPSIRAQFAFRLSFSPQDIVEFPKPSIVCTPNTLASRWTGHRIIGPANSSPTSPGARVLCGGEEAESVLHFAGQIGACIRHFIDLPLLQRAFEIESASSPSFDDCVTVLRLLERLSPDPAQGVDSKTKLINRLESRLRSASVQEVLLLRNLSTTGLSAADTLWAGLKSWAVTNSFKNIEDTKMLSAIDDALSESVAVDSWRTAVLEGVVSASLTSEMFSNAFWRWAEIRPDVWAALVGHLPRENDLEVRLADAAPRKLNIDTGNVVMATAQKRGWLRLHGVTASACLAPREAVARQLSIDAAPESFDGLRASLRGASPKGSIEIALELAEPRVLRIVAEQVANEPRLLGTLSFAARTAQELWNHAISINAEAWQGPHDSQRSFFTVIQNLLDGGAVSMELITALSKSPLADLSGFPRHAEVWHRLPDLARANCLRATATGWLQRALEGDVCTPGRELETAILSSNDLDSTLQSLAASVGKIVRIIETLESFDEQRFLSWIDNRVLLRHPVAIADAQVLGDIILSRRWPLAVDKLVQLARQGRADVKPALVVCQTMVGFFWWWSLGLSSASQTDMWMVLEELAADLYPNGPDDAGLWERAGGRDADLESFGTGRNRWRAAIGQLRRGRGPRVSSLLEEMRRDFYSNDQIRELQASRIF